MDTTLAVELAGNICLFVDFADECVSAAQKPFTAENQHITSTLLERTKKLKIEFLDDLGLLSQEDEIFLGLVNRCQKVSSQLLINLERGADHQPVLPSSNVNDGENLQREIAEIRQDLNEQLAPCQWLAVSQIIRELGAKNSRLNANRTQEIAELATSTDTYFQNIKSKEFHEGQKSALWIQILAELQKVADYSAEQVILSTLQFWTMDRRKELISKEHENTFEWILEEEQSKDPSQPNANFVDWLRREDPLYWISGKPGAGKSTLLKFIAENPKTIDGLNEWAGEDTLITASFYFWSSAKDPLQKSDTGLLRSILFQILRQCPDLIQHAYAEQWHDHQAKSSLQSFARTDLTTSDLLAAYQRIASLLSNTKVKFCFFIDGLDEYAGEPAHLIQLIESLSKTGNLKTCISSRPWTEFESIFGGTNPWKLYVNEFTKADMQVYVEDLLGKDQRFSKMKEADGEDDARSLVEGIVKSSEGVFLWVLLVVRSLLGGLDDTDHILDLYSRLAVIPNDLESYFSKMLFDIDPSMRENTAHIFEVTLDAAEKLPLMCYWFIQENTTDGVAGSEEKCLSKETATERLQQIQKRLITYSQGLLQVNNLRDSGQDPFSELEEQQWLFEFRVDFLHRTVADFFFTADMRKMLKTWSAESFNADFEISKACLATIKITPSKSIMFAEASRALSSLHLFFSHTKALEEVSQFVLIDELFSALRIHDAELSNIKMMILGPGNYWSYDSSFNFAMLYHCVSYGLGEYVNMQLDRGLEFPEPPDALLLGCFSWDPRVRMEKFKLNFDIVQFLLRRKLDPNLAWGDRNFSFWQQLLGMAYSSYLKGTLRQADCDAIKCAVDHGADMKAPVEVYGGRGMDNTAAEFIVEKVLPREQFLVLSTPEISAEWSS